MDMVIDFMFNLQKLEDSMLQNKILSQQ